MADDAFIDIDVGDAVELQAVEEGEYNILCNDAERREGDKGPFIMLRCEIPDIMESKGITHVMMLPQQSDDPKQQNRRKLQIKRACEAFGVDYEGGFNLSEFKNQEAEAYLTVEESEEYGRQNNIRRFVNGPEESEENRAEDLALQ